MILCTRLILYLCFFQPGIMSGIIKKTLIDLEFPSVLEQIASRCNTSKGKEASLKVSPLKSRDEIIRSLGVTSEYLSSFSNENRIPNHGFESIDEEIKLLKIENTILEPESFKKIVHIVNTAVTHKKFYKKFKEYYPLLFEETIPLEENKEIPQWVGDVIDRFGEIRDDASIELNQIRHQIKETRAKINQSFGGAIQRYQASDYLDEIKESIVENRRVLAVKAMYRRKVKGSVLGSSKTGSIVFIEPEIVLQYSRKLAHLEYDETEEIQRVLKALTDLLRPYADLITRYQTFLFNTDLTAAKAKYARDINALLPDINDDQNLFLREAYHPLLYLNNTRQGQKTWPQTIHLHSENRIIVISGPNAGGKSITLKTIGLLQLMLQSGILIPVHERSTVCFFDRILTDIGDNQSIENHLSTYSYRLKNMNGFLKKCNDGTLFLIDEFGTGSDPELGGALAEIFLEVFYERGSFGVITTHYANLKLLADELPYATNANMLFDSRTLKPRFQLETGQPGSSFTFEVAQQNGIPYSLINRARKKIERGKIRFDATIAKMQKERNKMAKTGSRLQEEESRAREEADRLEKINSKMKAKLEKYQVLYDHNQRMIRLGNKVNSAAEKYFKDKKKRPLVSELLRLVETENSKRKKKSTQEMNAEKEGQYKLEREVHQQLKTIRKEKKVKKELAVKAKPSPNFKIGDRVRLIDGKAVGSIDSLEKNKAVVNYGMFITNVSITQLELVEPKK